VDHLQLVLGRSATVAPPCVVRGVAHPAGPLTLIAQDDGLRVQLEVFDPSFVPGGYRETSGQRDVVVVFPFGGAPGQPAVELALDATGTGFVVDDVVPWETWGLRHGEGELYFVMAYFDREASGAENETRFSLHLAVRTPR
jgi:hypothetical protein